MTKWQDFYKILQVHHSAETEVIESAYKRLCKKYHPDINRTIFAEEKMKLINLAYSVLANQEKRYSFHIEWMKRNSKQQMNHCDNSLATKNNLENKKAQEMLEKYFNSIILGNFSYAYLNLSRTDKERISESEFVSWQKAVCEVYRIGNFNVKLYCIYDNHIVDDVEYERVWEFSVEVNDKNIVTEKYNTETITKFVTYNNGIYSLLLGYKNIGLLTDKFERLSKIKKEANTEELWADVQMKRDQATGILNKYGFIELAEKENKRSIRYNSIFSIALIEFKPINDSEDTYKKHKQMNNFKHMANFLKINIRETDLAAKWDENRFIILFTETNEVDAKKAVIKIIDSTQDNEIIEYNISFGISENKGEKLLQIISNAETNLLFIQN